MSPFIILLKRPTFIFKIVELVLVFTCVVMIINTDLCTSRSKLQLIYAIVISYIMANTIVLLGHLLGTPLHKCIILAILVTGGVMFVTFGAMIIDIYIKLPFHASFTYSDVLGSGILAILIGGVYFLDSVLTCREEVDVVKTGWSSVLHS